MHSTPPLGGGFGSVGILIAIRFCTEKNRMVWLPEGKKIEDRFIRFYRNYERDRHTDRLMDRHSMTAKAALA